MTGSLLLGSLLCHCRARPPREGYWSLFPLRRRDPGFLPSAGGEQGVARAPGICLRRARRARQARAGMTEAAATVRNLSRYVMQHSIAACAPGGVLGCPAVLVRYRHETPRGPAQRLADRLSVVRVVLVALAVEQDGLRAYQPHRVAELFPNLMADALGIARLWRRRRGYLQRPLSSPKPEPNCHGDTYSKRHGQPPRRPRRSRRA